MGVKRRACSWCIRVTCSCGWTGYRSKAATDPPTPCPWCWRADHFYLDPVFHRMSTVCHFIPAAELIKLKE